LFGSCVSVNIRNKKYLCTASHVLENVRKTNTTVVAGVTGKFIELKLNEVVYLTDESIDYDMCLIPCELVPQNVKFVPDSNFSDYDRFDEVEGQYLQGFPIAKNKAFDIHDHENMKIKTGYLKASIKIEQDIKHEIKGVSNSTHLLFKYNNVYYQKGTNEFSYVTPKNSPNLVGLSGSGLWTIKNIDDPSTIQLAGIFTTLSKGVGVGTKINNIVAVL
jgi:hypothetical protein